jgi:hypothetical protein
VLVLPVISDFSLNTAEYGIHCKWHLHPPTWHKHPFVNAPILSGAKAACNRLANAFMLSVL